MVDGNPDGLRLSEEKFPAQAVGASVPTGRGKHGKEIGHLMPLYDRLIAGEAAILSPTPGTENFHPNSSGGKEYR